MRIITMTLLLVACGGSSPPGDEPDAGGDDAGVVPAEPRFVPDAACVDGACLVIDAVPGASEVEVTLTTRGLGEVFGLSAHLTWDPAVLALDDAAGAQSPVLDPDDDGQAHMLTSLRPGDLALGGTRASPEAGPVSLDDETTLARLRFTVAAPGDTRLDATRAVVVRADGAIEPVHVAGGTLELPEVTR